MPKIFCNFIVVFLLAQTASFAAKQRCAPGSLEALFVRNATDTAATENLGEISPDFLIHHLVATHVQSFRSNDSGVGRATLRKFDPSWIFHPRFATELEMILERFTEGATDHNYDPVHFLKWLGDWEQVYVKAGLGVSGHWNNVGKDGITGKKRFVRQIMLRLAIRMQGYHFALAAPVLWRWQSEEKNFINFFSAEIPFAFGNTDNFQTAYDKFFRSNHGRYITAPRGGAVHPLTELYAALRQSGKSFRRTWHPWVIAWRQNRIQTQKIDDWIDGIQYWQEQHLPLVPLFVIDDSGRTDWSRAVDSIASWDKLSDFIRDLNAKLKSLGMPQVEVGVGVKRGTRTTDLQWRQELLVQAALYQIRTHWFDHQYVEMTVGDPQEDILSNPYSISATDPLWTQARLTIHQLNEIIYRRLIEPPLN